jgi:hypothetical protein
MLICLNPEYLHVSMFRLLLLAVSQQQVATVATFRLNSASELTADSLRWSKLVLLAIDFHSTSE